MENVEYSNCQTPSQSQSIEVIYGYGYNPFVTLFRDECNVLKRILSDP
jgi:hypothetical protein